MATGKELLNWNFKSSAFKTNAKRLITSKTKMVLNENKVRLNDIAKQSMSDNVLPKQKVLEEMYYKFKSLEQQPLEFLLVSFTKREVRLLVWALDYKQEDSILYSNHFPKFKSLVSEYWRDSYIIPIWYVLLNNWKDLDKHKARKQEFTAWLKKNCDEYDKLRKDVLVIKEHFSFWQTQGDERFAAYLKNKGIHISNVCTKLNMNTNILSTTYYYEMYLGYLYSIHNGSVSTAWIEEVLSYIKKLENVKYRLLLISVLITESKFSAQLTNIQNVALTHIGDPIVKRYWGNSYLDKDEKAIVEAARRKLIVLMNKDFIEFFFSELVQDTRRKAYWLKFIDHIEDIRFVGNRYHYSILKNKQEISKYVDSRYTITKRNQQTCALVISAKDYVFIEFSDTGSIYIYLKENFKIKLKHVEKIEDLKIWPKDMSIIKKSLKGNYYPDLYPEGTLSHRGEWEIRLDIWKKKYFYS